MPLDPQLQTKIHDLQTKHTSLVEAVRGYSGGSVASTTNEAIEEYLSALDTASDRESRQLDKLTSDGDPSMLLDFASQTYFTGLRGLEQAVDPHKYLTVDRATSKWVMGPQGRLVEVPPNTLAYEYDPVTGEAKGALIEESRTNLLKWSEDFTQSKELNYCTVSLSAVESPISGTYYTKIIPDDQSSGADIFDGYGPSTSRTVVSGSLIVRGGGGVPIVMVTIGSKYSPFIHTKLYIDLDTGEYSESIHSDMIDGAISVVPMSDGAFLVSCTGGQDDDNPSLGIRISPREGTLENSSSFTGDGSSFFYITALQIEEGPMSSSYIPTTDSPVTRAADSVKRELGDEATGGEFTVYASGTQIANPGTYFSITGPRGYSENGVRVGVPTNGDRTMWSSVRGPTNLPPFPDANPGGFNKVAVTVTKDDVFVSINGAVDRKSRNKNTLVLDSLKIGQLSGNNNNMNGPLSEITYYPYAMSETELQELTANG